MILKGALQLQLCFSDADEDDEDEDDAARLITRGVICASVLMLVRKRQHCDVINYNNGGRWGWGVGNEGGTECGGEDGGFSGFR